MAIQVGPDSYGRSVMQTITGTTAFYQVYTDFTNTTVAFTVSMPNTNLPGAMASINSMAPANYVPPAPPPYATMLNNLTEDAPNPTRTLNSAFMVNAYYATFVCYTVQISCTATLVSGQSGKVELFSDANPNPTTSRGYLYNANTVSLALAVTMVNTQSATLSYCVPVGHYVKLVTSGNAAITLAGQSEVVVAQ